MNKIIFLTITTLFAISGFAQKEKDEQALRAIVSTIESSWNNKSGQAFASVFADVHDYIVVNGLYFPGFTRQGNATAHQSLFDGVYKSRNVTMKVDKVQFVRPDLAMIHALAATYDIGTSVPADPGAIMTILAEKQKDGWKIISFHNHELNPDLKQKRPMPLNVMFASWYGKK